MKKAIIVASFGTSYADTRKKTIDLIEKEIEDKFPSYEIFRAYTSNMVRSILKKRDGINIFSPSQIVEKLLSENYSQIFIQPTHVISGVEYEKLKLNNTILGLPLLHDNVSFDDVIDALELNIPNSDTAVVFMGHGSYHNSDFLYKNLQQKLNEKKLGNVLIGTVEGEVGINDILTSLAERRIKKVELFPFMMVAGDHAHNDMAGDDNTSWKSVLENNGYEVSVILKGIGEYIGIRRIIYESLQNTINENL